MRSLLWLVPALPLAGFVVLAAAAGRLTGRGAALVGTWSVGLSALASLLVAGSFLAEPPPGDSFTQTLATWVRAADFEAAVSFRLDALSLTMIVVVTFVAFLIHLYSSETMADEEGSVRFFASMNLFVAMMLVLVLADNLLLLYLGWEGVGLCSYLLIGFWYKEPANGAAAQKAFVVTRVGDTAMAIGLFLLFVTLGTLDIQEAAARAARQWAPGSGIAVAVAALLLGGAVGKSAQIPLQTWLPDAMAGPTPVSALIHAATMVTAGVYLIARTHALFELAPAVMGCVAAIGAATLLVAGTSALVQRDIKRVLAYSTISQLGYMFMALGVGAWSLAIFHFATHAFFKALLFLGAGVVIDALRDEHDIRRMGGLRKELPLTFWTFLAASASLAGVPLVTAGFYSKDAILLRAWDSPAGGHWLWAAGWLGVFLTGIYIFRVVFLVFFGEASEPVGKRPGLRVGLPLAVLAFLSLVSGFPELPAMLDAHGNEWWLMPLSSLASLGGIFVAYLLFLRRPRTAVPARGPAAGVLRDFLHSGWGFDRLYDAVLVRPFTRAAEGNRDDFVDSAYDGAAAVARFLNRVLRETQGGRLRRYAAAIVGGAVALVAAVMFL